MKDYAVLDDLIPKTQELHRAIFDKGYEQGQKDILEQQPCKDWHDVPSDEMTLEQARQAVKDLRKKLAEDLINQKATTCRHGGHCEWVACDRCNHYEPDGLNQQPCGDAISRQAAIDIIESWLSCDDYNDAERHIMRAMQSVLYDLPSVKPQQPCEDCISRQSVKRRLQEHHDFFIHAYNGFSNMPQNDKSRVDEITNCIAMIVNEPSVTPKEKTGRWIFDEILDRHYYCSECKSMGVDYWDYCPNCGCRMVESQE